MSVIKKWENREKQRQALVKKFGEIGSYIWEGIYFTIFYLEIDKKSQTAPSDAVDTSDPEPRGENVHTQGEKYLVFAWEPLF